MYKQVYWSSSTRRSLKLAHQNKGKNCIGQEQPPKNDSPLPAPAESENESSVPVVTEPENETPAFKAVKEEITIAVRGLKEITNYLEEDCVRFQQVIDEISSDQLSILDKIGDLLVDLEYHEVVLQIFKQFNRLEVIETENIKTWVLLYYTSMISTNYTESSEKFSMCLEKSEAVELLTELFKHTEYDDDLENNGLKYGVFTNILITLHNIVRFTEIKFHYKESKTAEKVMPLIGVKNEFICSVAMLLLAYIIDEDENDKIVDENISDNVGEDVGQHIFISYSWAEKNKGERNLQKSKRRLDVVQKLDMQPVLWVLCLAFVLLGTEALKIRKRQIATPSVQLCSGSQTYVVDIGDKSVGFVKSPNYPGYYQDNTQCSVKFRTQDQPLVINLFYRAFSLEMESSQCSYDSLCANGVKFCGSWASNSSFEYVVPKKSIFTLSFVTDVSVTASGFEILVSSRAYSGTSVSSPIGGVGTGKGQLVYSPVNNASLTSYSDKCKADFQINYISMSWLTQKNNSSTTLYNTTYYNTTSYPYYNTTYYPYYNTTSYPYYNTTYYPYYNTTYYPYYNTTSYPYYNTTYYPYYNTTYYPYYNTTSYPYYNTTYYPYYNTTSYPYYNTTYYPYYNTTYYPYYNTTSYPYYNTTYYPYYNTTYYPYYNTTSYPYYNTTYYPYYNTTSYPYYNTTYYPYYNTTYYPYYNTTSYPNYNTTRYYNTTSYPYYNTTYYPYYNTTSYPFYNTTYYPYYNTTSYPYYNTTYYPYYNTTYYPYYNTTYYPNYNTTYYPYYNTTYYPYYNTTYYPYYNTTYYPNYNTTYYPNYNTTYYPYYNTTYYPNYNTTYYPYYNTTSYPYYNTTNSYNTTQRIIG